ncbi:hypothetical protein BT67DRAFT_194061 [Trichocladium antarcticum]|uniref:Uncharacterized protein n=1 Tax=Trichocladium antarcticum TaxID=1450529 RepID=A0AAN6UQ63_9PEZI|nr:hypothetical protein BT67DRAFT_194061 [Trichocladium antarcticum]
MPCRPIICDARHASVSGQVELDPCFSRTTRPGQASLQTGMSVGSILQGGPSTSDREWIDRSDLPSSHQFGYRYQPRKPQLIHDNRIIWPSVRQVLHGSPATSPDITRQLCLFQVGAVGKAGLFSPGTLVGTWARVFAIVRLSEYTHSELC